MRELFLAAVFCVLGVLPLIVMTQLGIIVGLGILLDTFIVRTLVIPALFALLGDRIWWPTHPRTNGAQREQINPGRNLDRGRRRGRHRKHRQPGTSRQLVLAASQAALSATRSRLPHRLDRALR